MILQVIGGKMYYKTIGKDVPAIRGHVVLGYIPINVEPTHTDVLIIYEVTSGVAGQNDKTLHGVVVKAMQRMGFQGRHETHFWDLPKKLPNLPVVIWEDECDQMKEVWVAGRCFRVYIGYDYSILISGGRYDCVTQVQ